MNRKIKNVVMIAIITIVCILSYFTMNAANKSSIPSNGTFKNNFGGSQPNFNKGEFSQEDFPKSPSGNFEKGEMPNIEELPENFAKGEIPNMGELPENFEKGEIPEGIEDNFKEGNFYKGEFKQNISVIYYILFAVEGLIISLLLIYLIMSRFNSKTFKETLGTGKQRIIFIILVLVLTTGLTVAQTMLSKNVFVANNMTQFENMQRPRNDTNNLNNTNEINEVENI